MTSPLPLGIVLPDLDAYRDLVNAIATSSLTQEVEFTYRHPIFKGNDAIVAGLQDARTSLDKFNVYFQHAIADERERVRFAAAYRKRYLAQHPRSEGQDILRASREVLQFRFVLKDPGDQGNREDIARALEQAPHDSGALAEFRETGMIPRSHRTAYLALFLDNVHNPIRQQDPHVQEVMYGPREGNPVICELMTNGALPALFGHVVGPMCFKVHAAIVFLEESGDGRNTV